MSSKQSRSRFPFVCGCKDSKSVSVPVPLSDTSDKSAATSKDPQSLADSQTAPTETTFSSSFEDCEDAATSSSNPSFSGLLRQLSELEKSVIEWAPPIGEGDEREEQQGHDRSTSAHRRRRHGRCRSDGGGRLEESVAVVKESEDPLADFRRSMLQMIVEKEIVGGEELRELLRRFLRLNSPRHHDIILRAFAEIWNEVFSGYEDTPDVLRRSRSNYYPRQMLQ